MLYLCIKEHNQTGLKYLCKTERDDYDVYQGSGKYWKRHIKKHGYDVTTTCLFQTEDKEEFKEKGLFYSQLWKIVESKEWANFRPETGDGGGDAKIIVDYAKSEKGRKESSIRATKTNKKMIEIGLHPFMNGLQQKRIEQGNHNFIGDNHPTHKRIEEGSFHWQGEDGSLFATQRNKKWIAEGKHPGQKEWICEHCGKKGNHITNYNRWHSDNCKMKNNVLP